MAAKKQIEKDIEDFFENISDDHVAAYLDLGEVSDDVVSFVIGEDEKAFTLSYPSDYPKNKEGGFLFFSEDDGLSIWTQELNEYAERKGVTLKSLLAEACTKFVKMSGSDGKKEEEEEDDDELLGISSEPHKKEVKKVTKSAAEQEIERKFDDGGFLEIGSPQATLRLLNDLKSIAKQKPTELGFTPVLVKEQKSGLENLYHWHIKLWGIDKDSPLYKDMVEYKKKGGGDHILLEMRFSKDYPMVPPFVRVVKPRFQFRTGHVTLGGSICMELLTNSGWSSTNDIESILVQITAELVSGGARLDPGYGGNFEYSEQEAWEAFYRAAGSHGWNTKGLGKDMFPKV